VNGLGVSRVLSGALAAWCCLGVASVGAAERSEPASTAQQRPTRAPQVPVTATAIAEHTSVQPGGSTRIGILFEIEDGWHIYWKDPGDAGVATKVEWSGPAGVSISTLDWPAPQEFVDAGNIHTFGYTESVALSNVLAMTPEASGLTAVPLQAKVRWVACEHICLPGSTTRDLSLPVSTEPPALSANANRFPPVHSNRD